jgi:hypothetical protein
MRTASQCNPLLFHIRTYLPLSFELKSMRLCTDEEATLNRGQSTVSLNTELHFKQTKVLLPQVFYTTSQCQRAISRHYDFMLQFILPTPFDAAVLWDPSQTITHTNLHTSNNAAQAQRTDTVRSGCWVFTSTYTSPCTKVIKPPYSWYIWRVGGTFATAARQL